MWTDRHGEDSRRIFSSYRWNAPETWRTVGQELMDTGVTNVAVSTTMNKQTSINVLIFLLLYIPLYFSIKSSSGGIPSLLTCLINIDPYYVVTMIMCFVEFWGCVMSRNMLKVKN
jgi:hypothetical protein